VRERRSPPELGSAGSGEGFNGASETLKHAQGQVQTGREMIREAT